MESADFPTQPVRRGDRPQAATMNAIINWIKRQQVHVSGSPFIQTPDGTMILSRGKSGTGLIMARVVCNGPEAEPPPTTNNYWLQASQLIAAADPNDPDEPPVTDLKVGDVFLGVNLAEQLTGSHGLRVGEEVAAWRQGDSTGTSRWVFCR